MGKSLNIALITIGLVVLFFPLFSLFYFIFPVLIILPFGLILVGSLNLTQFSLMKKILVGLVIIVILTVLAAIFFAWASDHPFSGIMS